MTSCITLEVYDKWSEASEDSRKLAMLEHFTVLPVASMGLELERRLANIREVLSDMGEGNGWTGQTVAALMVQQSAEDKGCGGLPTYQPCVEIDRGCKDVWRLLLGPQGRQYDLRCYRTGYDQKRGQMAIGQEVDWRAAERI